MISMELRCPCCNRLLAVDIIGNLLIDYSSNVVKDLEDGADMPPMMLESKCKHCKSLSSIYTEMEVAYDT